MLISWIYHPIMQWYAFFRFNNPPSESMVNNSKDASRFWRLGWEDANACLWHWFLFNYLRFIVFFEQNNSLNMVFIYLLINLLISIQNLNPEKLKMHNSWVTATSNKGRKNESSLCDTTDVVFLVSGRL